MSMPPASSDQAQQFERLVRPHVSFLYGLAYRLCGSVADAEDLVQEVLTKLYPRTAALLAIDALRPWLARVLYREFVDSWRKDTRKPDNAARRTENADGNFLESLECPAPGPELASIQMHAQTRIQMALDRLQPEERALVTLHLLEEYTLSELCTVFDVPLGTLKSRLHRTKAKLKEWLKIETFSPH